VLAWRTCKCYCSGDLGDTKIDGKASSAIRVCGPGALNRNSRHLGSGIDKESIAAESHRCSVFDSAFDRIKNDKWQYLQENAILQNNGAANKQIGNTLDLGINYDGS
jgi:hypothetical protein